MTRLVRLYPAAWRERYEVELKALLDERPPDVLDRLDIIRGAIDARLHPQGRHDPPEPAESLGGLRLAGSVATIGGVLWALASIGFYGAPYINDLGYKDSGSVALVGATAAAVTGLAAVMIIRLMADRSVVLWGSAAAIALGAIGLALPWPIVLVGFFGAVIGTLLFGLIGTSRLGPAYLLVGVGALLALGFNTEDGRALWLIPLGAAWVIVGTMMVRGAPAVSRRLAGQVVVVKTSPRTPRAAD
jgi:hypothetical protein